jgi:hypothetical protein
MPNRLFFGLIAAVFVAAALTVAVATSIATPHWSWTIVPLIIAVGLRYWMKTE